MKFSKKFKFTVLVPALIIVAGLVVGMICGGMNLGIDFTGGTMMTIDMGQDFDTAVVAKAFQNQGFAAQDITVTVSGSGDDAQALVRFPDTNDGEKENEIRAAVEEEIKATYADSAVASIERVGAVAGKELVSNAVTSVAIACVLMLIYITFRFELHFGITAVIALLVDVGVMLAGVTILRLQVNSSFIAAVLTIVGYAINDTIVIFDRIRTLRKRSDAPLADVVNASLHEVLRRTIITTVTTCIAIATVLVVALVMHVDSIISFALPMLLGAISGSYSSLFLSGPIWVRWMERRAAKGKK